MAKTYYHLTSVENAARILKTGLKPTIGPNSKMVCEDKKAIYLCHRKDIPYWKILLGKDIVLKVTVDDDSDFDKYEYSNYNEWVTFKSIPAKVISKVELKISDAQIVKAMTSISIMSLYKLSRMCEACARYYSLSEKDDEYAQDLRERILYNGIMVKATMKNIDSSIVSKYAIRRHLKFMSNTGMFTFCDTYKLEDKRLWEKLIEFEKDDLYNIRSHVYKLIIKKLDGCLDVNTGCFS